MNEQDEKKTMNEQDEKTMNERNEKSRMCIYL